MIIDIFNHFMPRAYFDRLGDFIPGHPVLAVGDPFGYQASASAGTR